MSIIHGLLYEPLRNASLTDAILDAADRLHAREGIAATHAEVNPLTLAKWPNATVEGISIGPHTRVVVPVGWVYVGVETMQLQPMLMEV